jgi:hypothetical protein
MKQYPSIPHLDKFLFGETIWAFDKLDGSNLRFTWERKRGWTKFGSRRVMIDQNSNLQEGVQIFMNKYSEDLERIFLDKYKSVQEITVFGEFFGEGSFAGQHVEGDPKDVILFDVNVYKRGLIPPSEFMKNFGDLDIPGLIYQGIFDEEFIKEVKENKFNLKEGVIVKSSINKVTHMTKIKTNDWLNKVKEKLGEKRLKEELYGEF